MPHQLSLFDTTSNQLPNDDQPLPADEGQSNAVEQIPGLVYVQDYITPSEHDTFIQLINEGLWLTELKRRVQHYGYRYDYKARQINLTMRVGVLPSWLQELAARLHASDHIAVVPDQVIVNEYTPGQGIADHVDCEPCFADTVISLSLGSGCMMNFTRKGDKQRIAVWLEPRSIVVLKGGSRYDWMHGIPARKTDEVAGLRKERGIRISLTFRKVILE